MKSSKYNFVITVDFDPDVTDVDSVGFALDKLLYTAIDTPGILDDCGNPDISEVDGTLQGFLEKPDVDDANYVLREVYRHMGIDAPSWL